MARSEDRRRRGETLLEELVQVDRDLAADLLGAVTAYTEAEIRLAAIDNAAGHGVPRDRLDRLDRLEVVRLTLERRLGDDEDRRGAA